MGPWAGLANILGGSMLSGIGSIIGKIWGNREKVQDAVGEEQAQASANYQSEFQMRGQRFWFDSLIDGLNRLPRPFIAFAVLGVMIYAPIDPLHFTIIMQAYSIVPEWLTYIFAQIILLYFGGRMLDKWSGDMGGANAKDVKKVLEVTKELQVMREQEKRGEAITEAMTGRPREPLAVTEDGFAVADAVATAKPMKEEKFEAAMEDDSKPLTNKAILEWNRRRQMQEK